MPHTKVTLLPALLLAALVWPGGLSGAALAAELTVISVDPAARSLTVPVNSPITVTFDRAVNPATVTPASFHAFGRWSGPAPGGFTFEAGDTAVTLTPVRPFSAGETVTVFLSNALQAADGSPMRGGGYSFQFWTASRPATRTFAEVQRLSTRTTATQPTQAYGGIGTDLDHDGWLDLTIVNEITADLRVFMNKADATATVDPFLTPPTPVGNRASPSEPADFDGDGTVDICVVNIDDDNVSIRPGNGDGSFGAGQNVPVGDQPRGIAVLDADGDGDVDVAATSSGASLMNLALMLNDGTGTFGVPTLFPSGMTGAWALTAADMNEDGLLDLIAGSRNAQQVVVHTGNGDGTFTATTPVAAGGRVWMINAGDVNGDGHDDVATINSFDNTGSILFGDGAGGLSAPQVYAADPFGLATDLGDVDGDGDLDWVTSSLNGDWRLNVNDGDGTFSLDQEFTPTDASSCALMLDLDNDGDLDLALIDEQADELILERNDGLGPGASPPGAPSGAGGTVPVMVAKNDPAGTSLTISWDTLTCTGATTRYHIVRGGSVDLPPAPGADFGVSGSECDIGTVSPYVWGVSPDPALDPAGLVWFLIVAGDGTGAEGSWGLDGAGAQRTVVGPGGSSGECGAGVRDLSNSCGN